MRAACTVAACNSLDSARNPRRAFFFGHGLGFPSALPLFCFAPEGARGEGNLKKEPHLTEPLTFTKVALRTPHQQPRLRQVEARTRLHSPRSDSPQPTCTVRRSCKPVVSCPHSSRAPLAPAPRALAPLPPRTPRWQPTRSFKRTPAQAQASTARPGRAGAFISVLRGRRSFAPAPRRTRAPRSAATAPARGRCCERTRSGYSGGEARGARGAHRSQEACSEPLEIASTAGGELALTRRRTRGVRRGARRRQAAATGAVRAALLYAAVARPSCRAIGRGAAC